jgi:hypothetical protein
MAKTPLNPAVGPLKGRVDGWVYRQVLGQTVVSRRPQTKDKAATEAQAVQRQKFSGAIAYAQRILGDPWHLKMYQALARAQNRRYDKLLVSDYLTPPTVEEIDLSEYNRQPGSRITILALDDVEVVSVRIVIRTAANVVVEEGWAEKEHEIWRYRATARAPVDVLTVMATATDRPAHTGTLTVVCPTADPS